MNENNLECFKPFYLRKGYNQKALSEESGVSRLTIRNIEKGADVTQNQHVKEKLADTLDTDLATIGQVIQYTKDQKGRPEPTWK